MSGLSLWPTLIKVSAIIGLLWDTGIFFLGLFISRSITDLIALPIFCGGLGFLFLRVLCLKRWACIVSLIFASFICAQLINISVQVMNWREYGPILILLLLSPSTLIYWRNLRTGM